MIARFDYTDLRRDEQLMFNEKALKIATECHLENHKAVKNFEESAKRLSQILQTRAFGTPSVLTELDKVADRAWSALNYQLKASMWHPVAEIREAATQIHAIFSQTDNPTMLSYDQEYGALQRLLSQLSALPSDLFSKALVDLHVVALREAVENFINASTDRNNEQSKMKSGEIKEAFNACAKDWKNLVKFIELTNSLEPSADIENAMRRLNILCSDTRRKLENRKNGDNDSVEI